MFWALLLAASATVAATGCTEKASETSTASPGTGGVVQFDTPFSDPHDTMARALVQTDKISLPEARRRLVLQHEVGILAARMRATYGDRFAGAAIERTPTFQAKYYFVGIDLVEVGATLSKLGASAELLPLIRLEAAAETQAQMRAKAVRMQQQLRDHEIDGTVAVGITGFKITTLQAEEAAEAVRKGRVEGGDAVVIERSVPLRISF